MLLLANDTFDRNCPTRGAEPGHQPLGHPGPGGAGASPHRFAALRNKVSGISEKMLSQTLKSLVRAGLVDRAVEQTTPPQVTYSLTELGAGIAGPLCELIHWVGEPADTLLASQAAYDAQERTHPGQPLPTPQPAPSRSPMPRRPTLKTLLVHYRQEAAASFIGRRVSSGHSGHFLNTSQPAPAAGCWLLAWLLAAGCSLLSFGRVALPPAYVLVLG